MLALPITDTTPIDPRDLPDTSVAGDAEAATQVLVSPVFRNDSARRRRLLRRAGCVIATLCLGYLTMLGVAVTAVPILRTPPGITPIPDILHHRGIARMIPPTGHRNPTVAAQAPVSARHIRIAEVDDRDELTAANGHALTPTPTRIPQIPPTPATTLRAHRTHPHPTKTAPTKTSPAKTPPAATSI